jgi:hypothetical protein
MLVGYPSTIFAGFTVKGVNYHYSTTESPVDPSGPATSGDIHINTSTNTTWVYFKVAWTTADTRVSEAGLPRQMHPEVGHDQRLWKGRWVNRNRWYDGGVAR